MLRKTGEALVEIEHANITALTFERGRANGAEFGRLDIDCENTPMVPFLPIETISLSETRKWCATQSGANRFPRLLSLFSPF